MIASTVSAFGTWRHEVSRRALFSHCVDVDSMRRRHSPGLTSSAGKRRAAATGSAGRKSSAAQPLQPSLFDQRTISSLREAAADCTACDLYKNATQTVFGEGPRRADVILVGEQPGNEEDLSGKPFVGPAGRLLNNALIEAGIARDQVYVTNVVKHFKWEPRGKRRIHKKPNTLEINACRPWLEAEILLIRPRAIMLLGSTAAQALLGPQFRVTRERGKLIESPLAPFVMATIHPSSILRAPDAETRQLEHQHFVNDLKILASLIQD
jgi:DNA polymerase